jgi:hypothetical protein
VLQAGVDADVIGRTRVVRDGIEYVFEERNSGSTIVYATRRLKRYKRAVFQVFDRNKALVWMNDGAVPDEKTREALSLLQAGTWPKPLRSTSRPF